MSAKSIKEARLSDGLNRAIRAGVPIASVTTSDPASVLNTLTSRFGDRGVAKWDLINGVRACNELGATVLGRVATDETVMDPVGFAREILKVEERGVVVMLNAHRYLGDTAVMQAIWNVRDAYKSDGRMLVLVGVSFDLPAELTSDVVQFDDPLPGDDELEEIVRMIVSDAEDVLEFKPDDQAIKRCAQAVKGASAFGAEQLFAMSLSRTGIDEPSLVAQAKKLIEQTPGLTFEVGTETFDEIGGLGFAKEFGERLFGGPSAPAVVVRLEELEKTLGNAGSDLSGTSSDALQVILSEMEDNGWSGLLAFGAPGAGKSLYAKSLANTFGAKPIRFDVNATKGSLVGQSEQSIRQAMKVIKTLGGSRVFFVASVNGLDRLPPELQRRFRCGVWFFDAPGKDERAQIWDINRAKFGIEEPARDEEDLTGADIRNICEMAHTLSCSLEEARRYVVPLKTQSPDSINSARLAAESRFICAANGGAYRKPDSSKRATRRRITG